MEIVWKMRSLWLMEMVWKILNMANAVRKKLSVADVCVADGISVETNHCSWCVCVADVVTVAGSLSVKCQSGW